jgi:hypothetical protein
MSGSYGKVLLFGGVAGIILLTMRACSAPTPSAPVAVQEQSISQGQESPANQPTVTADDMTIQRNQLLEQSLDESQKLVGSLICVRKEQFLLEAQNFQRDRKGSAERFLLGKVKQNQAIAMGLNNDAGTLTGTNKEIQSASNLIVDLYASQLAFQEVTQGKPEIRMCSVNLADGLLINQQMIELATVLDRASVEAKATQLEAPQVTEMSQ